MECYTDMTKVNQMVNYFKSNLIITRNQLLIIAAATLFGLITISGQYFSNKGFSLYEIALLITIVPILLSPLIVFNPHYRIQRDHLLFFVIFGLIGAALQLTQFGGIVRGVPVAVIALLLYTQPIWTICLGRILLNEKITAKKIVTSGLALIGIVILVVPFKSLDPFDTIGLILATLAGMLLALWLIWARKSQLKKLHCVTTTFGFTLFSSLWLFLAFPFFRIIWRDMDYVRLDFSIFYEHWLAILGFGIFSSVIPNFLVFIGMRKVEASTSGILLLFEPVAAAFMAFLFFKQVLNGNIWLGGGLILLANYILLRKKKHV